MNVTIVTMIYRLTNRTKEDILKYLEYGKEFILKLNYNLIIYTDDTEIIEFIKLNRTYKCMIYIIPLNKTYYYKDINTITNLQNKYIINNINLNKDTPEYIILNNNKFYFMEHSINMNPFNSTHFIWLDFRINYIAKSYNIIHEWINNIPNKIKQMCINPYIENIEPKTYFQYIYHNMAGGLFSGSKDNLLLYCNLFKNKYDKILSENWYQLDEAVMTIIQRENPDLFELYYGDYEGIIANYSNPKYNLELINISLNKCIKYNNIKLVDDIKSYLNCKSF